MSRSFGCLVLSAFLLACCAATVPAGEGVTASTSEAYVAPSSSPDSTGVAPIAVPEQGAEVLDRVVVTYFHRALRCEMCLAFEAYSEEALRNSFPDELADGRLVWSALSLDDEDNVHYEDDYHLTDLSVVVAGERDGGVVEWRALPDIWGLMDDKQAFLDYVTYEVGKTLEKVPRREWAAARK